MESLHARRRRLRWWQMNGRDPVIRTRAPRACEAAGATVSRFDIEQLERAVRSRPDRLVVAGGDGSIAPAAAAAGAAGIPLAVVPAGTANDFAERLGLPSDVAAACELAVQRHSPERARARLDQPASARS